MNIVCLVIDGLQAGYIGAYGNCWIETPALDRLAAEGFVFDQALIDTADLSRLYRSYWRGCHALVREDALGGAAAIVQSIAQADLATLLVTDDALVAQHPAAKWFRERVTLHPDAEDDYRHEIADEWTDCDVARLFAEVSARLDRLPEPFLVWAHARGPGRWDAPTEFREQYLDDEDADSPVDLLLRDIGPEVPDRALDEDVDPDELFALRRAYAGQVTLLDTCLAGLLEALDEHPAGQRTAVLLTGARGFPLGEHRRVGHEELALHEELIHVPLICRFPKELAAAGRSQALVQPADIAQTLLALAGASDGLPSGLGWGRNLLPIVQGETDMTRDRLILTNSNDWAIRTPGWYLRQPDEESNGAIPRPGPSELYAKPDDRWEVNEVSNRCEAVTEDLTKALAESREMLALHPTEMESPLDPQLLRGPD